jgi:hypothetical protein
VHHSTAPQYSGRRDSLATFERFSAVRSRSGACWHGAVSLAAHAGSPTRPDYSQQSSAHAALFRRVLYSQAIQQSERLHVPALPSAGIEGTPLARTALLRAGPKIAGPEALGLKSGDRHNRPQRR